MKRKSKLNVRQKFALFIYSTFWGNPEHDEVKKLWTQKGASKVPWYKTMRDIIIEYKSFLCNPSFSHCVIATSKDYIAYSTCSAYTVILNLRTGRHYIYAPSSTYFKRQVKTLFPGIQEISEDHPIFTSVKWYHIPRKYEE